MGGVLLTNNNKKALRLLKQVYYLSKNPNFIDVENLKNGKELGVKGVQEIVSCVDESNPINIIHAGVNALNFDQAKLRDDITCLCIKIHNKG